MKRFTAYLAKGALVVRDQHGKLVYFPARKTKLATVQAYANALDDLRASTLDCEVHRMVADQLDILKQQNGVQPTLFYSLRSEAKAA